MFSRKISTNSSSIKVWLLIKYNLEGDSFFVEGLEGFFSFDEIRLPKMPEESFVCELNNIINSNWNFFEVIENFAIDLEIDQYLIYLEKIGKNISLKEHTPWISMLESKGLIFDFSLVEESDQEYIGIDALDVIKFIPEREANKTRAVEFVVGKYLLKARYKEIKSWLMNVFYNHAYSSEVDEGQIGHILDWMNSDKCDRSTLLENMSFEKALKKANRWTELENERISVELNEKRAQAKLEGRSIEIEGIDIRLMYTTSNGLRLYKIITDIAKKLEGSEMKNCIGSSLHSNNDNLYSLRIGEDKRVCSLDIRGNIAKEIKGYNNKKVEQEYWVDVRECLAALNVDIKKSNNLTNIGLKCVEFILKEFNINKIIVVEQGSSLFEGPEKRVIEASSIYYYTRDEELERRKLLIEQIGSSLWEYVEEGWLDFINKCPICPIHQVYVPYNPRMDVFYEVYENTKFEPFKDFLREVVDYNRTRTACFPLRYESSHEKLKIFIPSWWDFVSKLSSQEEERERAIYLNMAKELNMEVIPFLYAGTVFEGATNINELIEMILGGGSLFSVYHSSNKPEAYRYNKKVDGEADLDISFGEPDDCEHCNNYALYQEQESSYREAKDAVERYNSLLKEIEEGLENIAFIGDMSKKFSLSLKKIFINQMMDSSQKNIIGLNNIGELKDLYQLIQSSINDFLDDLSYNSLSEVMDELESLEEKIKEADKAGEEVSDAIRNIEKTVGVSCDGDEENEEEPCDGEAVVDENANRAKKNNSTIETLDVSEYLGDLAIAWESVFELKNNGSEEIRTLLTHWTTYLRDF